MLAVLGLRLTWRRALAIGAGVVALFFLVAGADWLRAPADRSHLGRFIQAILDGNASDIVVRKGQQNLDILLGNAPLTLLVPAALLFVIYLLVTFIFRIFLCIVIIFVLLFLFLSEQFQRLFIFGQR